MFNLFKKQKKEPKNLKEVLSYLKDTEKNLEKLSDEIENLKRESKFSIRKVGMIRFNPFSEVGGDQSFSLVLLDDNNNGLVMTSLYTRAGNRVYGKPIKGGLSEYSLSGEELRAIEKAMTKNNGKNNSKKLNTKTASSGGSRPY